MPDNQSFAAQKSSYRNLHVFQKTEAIYDLNYHFLQGNIAKSDRTYDQMLQAARSGKQNIVEGRADAASSTEMEIRLYGVARGSLHELLNDYHDFMRTRSVAMWEPGHPRFDNLRKMCASRNDTAFYATLAPRLSLEELCNLIVTLIRQAITMLSKLIELVKEDFLARGGMREQMFRARLDARKAK